MRRLGGGWDFPIHQYIFVCKIMVEIYPFTSIKYNVNLGLVSSPLKPIDEHNFIVKNRVDIFPILRL